MRLSTIGLLAGLVLLLPPPARASFHFMQIEQALGGVGGDATQQAVQLRMRSAGQNLVSASQIVVRDATGSNPVVVVQFGSSVAVSAAGSRILVASEALALTHELIPDAVMSNLIPDSYLAAGRLTFEKSGTIYWSLCWGGAGYTGSTTGSTTNDADGNFGPCFDGSLPSIGDQALRFTGAANAASTTNAADYALSDSPSSFVNNAGGVFVVSNMVIFRHGFEQP